VQRQQKSAAIASLVSAVLMLATQGGLMGDGWADVFRPEVWMAVASTQFGSVWLWQIVFAVLTACAAWIAPIKSARLLLLLAAGQLVLLAGVGNAAMHDGAEGVLQRVNHAIHLLCAAMWVGALLPLIFCLRLAKGRWRNPAIYTMMRFSRMGHYAVAGVILSGIVNMLLILGITLPWRTEYGQ